METGGQPPIENTQSLQPTPAQLAEIKRIKETVRGHDAYFNHETGKVVVLTPSELYPEGLAAGLEPY